MITFLDENDVEYGALATIKATNAVNGERSLTGTIVSGDYVLSKIERGWRLRFDDEYYVVTYAKPIDEGKNVQVSFDAVHQFFWDFGKSSVYDQLGDGSHTFRAYLDFIFNGSGYKYDIESSLTVKAFEKQSFGYKNRLSLFNDIITSSGVEFQVNGKVVRILAKVGTDLSTVVRKNFNLNELGIEKNIGNFVTYQKGFGAYFDEEDHSKGRLIAEYTSPLASVYGKLEADPLVDERYKQQESLLSALKETVDNSYTISVSLDMEDLTRAGYRYTQPVAGDYIMAINETLGFKEKIRIVSFTSEYDVDGQLIKHTVTCNDIGSVKKLSASYTHTQHQAANAEANANTAYEFANKALVSADGKNTNYYGDTFPVDNPKGTLKKGDLLFLTVGDTVKQYYWNGADWVINPVLDDVEAFKEQIADELKDVPNREEFENKISEEIANSKAEIGTQIETAKTQAETNAKEYADTINQETANVAELANAAANEIKADLVNVKNNLTATSLVANNAQAAVDAAKGDLAEVNTKVESAKAELTQTKQQLTTVADDLSQAKQDLTNQSQQLQAQANAQSELTKRVSSVEKTANGTKTTVSELTKTVAQNGKDITSVTNRTKIVEDDLVNTKTTLTQVQTTANSASQKTATLETGLNGLSAKFDNFKIGGANLLLYSADPSKAPSGYYDSNGTQRTSETYNGSVVYKTQGIWNGIRVNLGNLVDRGLLKVGDVLTYSVAMRTDQETPIQARLFIRYTNQSAAESPTSQAEIVNLTADWQYVSVAFTITAKMLAANTKVTYLGWELTSSAKPDKYVYYACNKIERGNVATDYSPSDADIEQKVAEYQASNDKMVASLKSSLQTTDGNVSNLQTKVEAVPGQITSAVSAVESKIPTSAGGRNLTLGTSADWSAGRTSFNGQDNQSGTIYRIYNRGFKIGDKVNVRIVLKYSGIVATEGQRAGVISKFRGNVTDWGRGQLDGGGRFWFDKSDGEIELKGTTVVDEYILKNEYWEWRLRVDYVKSGKIQWKEAKAEVGDLPTPWSPAPEDAASQISNLSSEIKQTADGITLLATKTELNTAKNELQSGINTATNKANGNAQTISTHTTQISALNTGLQAKVSQTEFNTLSGRVTTAENNITAKANELSSKISSVEGKIPTTSSGGRNLAQGTSKDWSKPFTGFSGIQNTCPSLYKVLTDGLVVGDTIKTRIVLKYTDIRPASGKTAEIWLQGAGNVTEWKSGAYPSGGGGRRSISGSGEIVFELTDKINSDHLRNAYWNCSFRTDWVASGSLQWRLAKAERGMFFTDWSPAPEDTINQISSLSSELKQTKDGITLLATKTELNTAKNELQSGINTATNKANSAQNTANSAQSTANSAQNKANSNAQTISTHTNQISALNTGLSAKVSQSDFNTLSGRVTTAENNITAKANELSSKITSVEGKLPTSVSHRNLVQGTSSSWSPFVNISTNTNWCYSLATIKYGDKTGIHAGTTINIFVYLSADELTLGGPSPSIRIQGMVIDKNGNLTWTNWDKYHPFKSKWSSNLVSGNNYRIVKLSSKVTSESFSNINGFEIGIRIDGVQSGKFHHRALMVTTGDIFPDSWSPAPEDAINQINSVSSEFKQTTDSIKASVSSLDSSTVKSSSLTINADGVVIKAGKSTSDFANAVGSYFSVNQNAINLFSDKINVKGSMIVSGAITSDKIASKQINTSHLNGKIITADVISSNAVTAGAIKAGAVTTDKMSANSINGDRIAAGTLDAAKIKAGSITASQIASGTITSNQIKAGTISAANIASGAITSDKIAANSIDASKIAANAITANMIRGGQLNSTNGATSFDLNAGTITFNNNYGYIQRVANDKIFEITTYLGKDAESQDYLTSAFNVRKSDYSRLAGAEFFLYNATADKPTARANITADTLMLLDSKSTPLFAIYAKGSYGNINFQGWGDIPVANFSGCGLVVDDIGIGGHFKSLLKIVEELCKKTGIPWV